MKQTAVEWLVQQLRNGKEFNDELIQQAKEMEKEQHGKTWDCAIDNLDARGGNVVRAWADFDDYYNETFKSE